MRLFLPLVLGILVAAASAAEPPPGPHGPSGRGPERLIERHAERLGLDEETVAAIQAVADRSAEKREAILAQLRSAHDEMRALLSSEDPDREAVMAKADVIGALEIELQKLRLGSMLEIRGLLTAEQRAALVEIREERQEKYGRHSRGRGRGFGPPPPGGPPLSPSEAR